MQHQYKWVWAASEPAVVRPIAVGGVAQDGVPEVFEVEADLVVTARFGGASHEGESGGGVARHGHFAFDALKCFDAGAGGFRFRAVAGGQGFVHGHGRLGEPAADEGVVGFGHQTLQEQGVQLRMRLRRARKHHQSTRRPIQPVHRLQKTVSTRPAIRQQAIPKVVIIVRSPIRPMHQQVMRLLRNQPLICLEDNGMRRQGSGKFEGCGHESEIS